MRHAHIALAIASIAAACRRDAPSAPPSLALAPPPPVYAGCAAVLDGPVCEIAAGATLKGELPMGRLADVGLNWVYRGEYEPLAQQIDLMFQVTSEEVAGVIRQHDLTATTILALGPLESL